MSVAIQHRFDVRQKLPAYARAGVVEVWIVNFAESEIEVYRDPRFNDYSFSTILRRGDIACPQVFADARIDVSKLLDLRS